MDADVKDAKMFMVERKVIFHTNPSHNLLRHSSQRHKSLWLVDFFYLFNKENFSMCVSVDQVRTSILTAFGLGGWRIEIQTTNLMKRLEHPYQLA